MRNFKEWFYNIKIHPYIFLQSVIWAIFCAIASIFTAWGN